jgi:hypothetical protein
MEMPSIFQGESLKRLLQGMAVGAVVTICVGFNWGGWMLGGNAKQMADTQASSAVLAALASYLRRAIPKRLRRALSAGSAEEGQHLGAGHLHRKGWLGQDACQQIER